MEGCRLPEPSSPKRETQYQQQQHTAQQARLHARGLGCGRFYPAAFAPYPEHQAQQALFNQCRGNIDKQQGQFGHCRPSFRFWRQASKINILP